MINSLKFILFFILIFVILTGCSGGSDESTVTEDEEIVFIEPEDDYEELEFEDTTNYETGYEIEPNDNTAEAQTIQSGVSYIGGYHGAYSDYDYYSFEAESGYISINFEHINQYDPSSDWDIFIYDSSLNTIGDFESDNGLDSTYTLVVNPGDLYFILIRSYSNDNQQYTLSLTYASYSNYEHEPNDNTAEAQVIQTGASYLGGYHGAYSDYDYYSFEPESGNISINFGHINQYDPSSDWDISMAANGGWHSFCYKRTEQRRNLLCEFDIPYQFFNPREYFFVVFCRIRHFLLYQMSINLGKLFRQI